MNFTLFGIKVRISFLFFSLLAFLFFTSTNSVLTYTIFFVVIHEIGHVVAMGIKGDKIERFLLKPFGVGIVKKSSMALSYQDEIFIYMAGPLLNLLLSAGFYLLYTYTSTFPLALCATVNLLLGVFNLLPVSVLDGGQMCKMKLLEHSGAVKGEKAFFLLSTVFSGLLLCIAAVGVSAFHWNVTLAITALYLFVSNFTKR